MPKPFTVAGICTPPPAGTVIVCGLIEMELTPEYSTSTLLDALMVTLQTYPDTESQPTQATKALPAEVVAGAVSVTAVPVL
jgi:hypothetical protein